MMSLLQIALILFLSRWVPFLHWQGGIVSYPNNGLALFGAFLLVAMWACALWDPWCSYQTPPTTEFPSALRSAFRSLKKLARMTVTPKTIRNALQRTLHRSRDVVGVIRERPSVLLHIFRRPEETPEAINVKSLCWMLGHAPRGRPLRLVAQQVARVRPSSDYQSMIQQCPHIHRLHETFWDTLRRLTRAQRDLQKIQNAIDKAEELVNIAIFGKSIVATSCQWPANSIEDVMRASFDEYASLLSWEGKCAKIHSIL